MIAPAPAAPRIFDRALYRRRRTRAADTLGASDFLHARVAADLVDRLESVTRDFPRAALLGAAGGRLQARLTPKCGIGEILACDGAVALLPDCGLRIVADEERLPPRAGRLRSRHRLSHAACGQ